MGARISLRRMHVSTSSNVKGFERENRTTEARKLWMGKGAAPALATASLTCIAKKKRFALVLNILRIRYT